MEKLAYLLWNDDAALDADAFRDRLLADLPARLATEWVCNVTRYRRLLTNLARA